LSQLDPALLETHCRNGSLQPENPPSYTHLGHLQWWIDIILDDYIDKDPSSFEKCCKFEFVNE